MKKIATLIFAAVFVAANVGFSWIDDDDKKPKYNIKQVMGKVFKGKAALAKKLTSGDATAEEKKMAVAYIEALGKNKPKKGDAESWKKKTDALTKATKDLVAGKEGAAKAFKAAANCAACHKMHKP